MQILTESVCRDATYFGLLGFMSKGKEQKGLSPKVHFLRVLLAEGDT